MADNKKPKAKKPSNSLVGSQAKPVVLDSTTKLDIDTNKVLIDNIIEAGLSNRLDIGALEHFTSVSNVRDQIYTLIDTMCQDSTVSSVVRTYAEEVCETADNGHIIWCESENPNISKFVNYLLNVINVDKNVFAWTYCLIKYGDVYLRLYRESDYIDKLFKADHINKVGKQLNEEVNLNVHNGNDAYTYYVEMIADPSTMFELRKYGQTFGYIEVPNNANQFDVSSYIGGTTGLMSEDNNLNFRYKSNDVNVYQADDFVHACLDDNTTRFPETVELFYPEEEDINSKTKSHAGSTSTKGTTYDVKRGKSMLYDSYKVWREKALLEAAILLSRLTKSGLVRKVGVEVGDMPKEQVQQTLRRVKEMFEQKSSFNTNQNFSEYTNPGAVENFIYYATHNGIGAISVESVGGDYDPKQLTDLDWWNNKFYASFGIPKQYFGFTDDGAGFNGGTSLSIISSVFAKGVKRVQNAILQAVSDLINLILFNKGLKSYLNNFVLKMRAPLTQEEIDYRTHFNDRANAISNINSLFTDVETKSRRLTILKTLVSTLDLGDTVAIEIQKEIDTAEEAEKKEAEQKKKEEEEALKNGGEVTETEMTETTETTEEEAPEADLDLVPMPDEEIKEESFNQDAGKTVLTEDQDLLFEDDDLDLPTPEEADADRDFTENK